MEPIHTQKADAPWPIFRPSGLYLGHWKVLTPMDVSKPFSALSPNVDVDVLVALAGSNTPRSGREIARRAGRSKTGTQHVLDRLVEHGLVDCLQTGRASLYSLNRDHLLAQAVDQMAGARAELIHRLRARLDSWTTPAVHASLFGSAARGDGDVNSDIDVFVVRPADTDADDEPWREQIDDLAECTRRWTGNHMGVAEVSETDLPHLRNARPPIVQQVQQDAIDLAGAPAKTLLQRS
jgi:predicted transcriptional regulator